MHEKSMITSFSYMEIRLLAFSLKTEKKLIFFSIFLSQIFWDVIVTAHR